MQSHLSQILAHYVVYIGSRLNLPIANDAERFILEAAPKRWHKEGIFRWLTASEHRQQREDVLPHYVDAKCNNGTLCTCSKINGIFTFNRVGFQNAMTTHAYDPAFLNNVDGPSWHNTPHIPNPESAFQQPYCSLSTNAAQPSRSSQPLSKDLIASLSNPFGLSPKSTHPAKGFQKLKNTSSRILCQSFSLSENRCNYNPLPASRTLIEDVLECDCDVVKGHEFASLDTCSFHSERERAVLEETQNLLV